MKSKAVAFILLFALVTSILAGWLSARANSVYLSQNPYYGDTASYTLFNVRAYLVAKHEGRWSAIDQQLAENGRNPLRIIPVLLLNPSWLASENGHLLTGTAILFAFCAMLGLVAYRYGNSLPWALAAVASPMSALHFFDPIIGLGANYPDLGAGMLLSSAYLALLMSNAGRSNFWLCMFGVFSACTALSRWTAGGYTFVLCAIPLAIYLLVQWRQHRWNWRVLAIKTAWAGGPVILLSGWYLARFSAENLAFYSYAAYGLGHGWELALNGLWQTMKAYFGEWGLALLGVLVLHHFIAWLFDRREAWRWLERVWAPSAFLVFFVFVLKLVGDPSTPYHMMMLVTASCTAMVCGWKKSFLNNLTGSLALALVLAMSIVGWQYVTTHRIVANPHYEKEFAFQQAITRSLVKLSEPGKPLVFDTFFFPYGRSIVIEAITRQRRELTWKNIFEKHDVFWRQLYPDQSPEQIGDTVFQRISKELDFLAIIKNPRTAEAEPLFWSDLKEINAIPIGVIERINILLQDNPAQWKQVEILDSPWGSIHLYKNLKRLEP